MRQRIILMILLVFGALSSCGEESDERVSYYEHVYCNQTDYDITIHGYSSDKLNDNIDWSIEPNDSIWMILNFPFGSGVPVPAHCDSVSVIFDNKKGITVGYGSGILDNSTYEMVSNNYKRYRHCITTELYDSARWLIPSDSVTCDILP